VSYTKLDDQRRSPETVERATLEERLCAMRIDMTSPDGPPEPEGTCPPLLCGTAVRWVPRAPDLEVTPRRDPGERQHAPAMPQRDYDRRLPAIGSVLGSFRILEHMRSERSGRIARVECIDCMRQRTHRMTLLRGRPPCAACWKAGGRRPGDMPCGRAK
jgi:hypothetical protein